MERLTPSGWNGHMTNFVLGGTGKTGRRVVRLLQQAGAPVRAASRTATPPFDWLDRTTWKPALHGVSAVYLSYYPDLATPEAPETIGAFTELAVSSGVT